MRRTARIARHLERRGLLVRDLESSHLTRAPGEDVALEILQGHSITYRIAMGPHEGRKAFTLQTVPAKFYGLPGFDAQMWARAEANGLSEILSEDLRHGRHYGAVRAMNPFLLPELYEP